MRLPRSPQAFAALFSLGEEASPPVGPSFVRGAFVKPAGQRPARRVFRLVDVEPAARPA